MPLSDATSEQIMEQLTDVVHANLPASGFVVTQQSGKLQVNVDGSVEVNGRQQDNMNLLSVIVQKHHVGFYFMPVYIDPDLKATMPETVGNMLKGKHCFHVKAPLAEPITAEFSQLIQAGIQLYRSKGWLDG